MLKRLFCLLLSLMILSAALFSCATGESQPGEESRTAESAPVSDASETDSAPVSDPETDSSAEPASEPVELMGPPVPVYEYEYEAPEDGSFTICGIPLSEYKAVLYFPTNSDYSLMVDEGTRMKKALKQMAETAGFELDLSTAKNERYDTERKSEHEILFGYNFRREGIPVPDFKKNYYGVTEDGTVYFCAAGPLLYEDLFGMFLEEFFGVPYGSEEPSGGCAISPFYRELPQMDAERLTAMGYSVVFEDDFDGDDLDWDVWEVRGPGPRYDYGAYVCGSQVSVSDGLFTITGEYREDGEYGAGLYSAFVRPKQFYCRGYFEASIRCSEMKYGSDDFWSAFWIQGPSPYSPEQSQGGIGPGGCEIDIMECWTADRYSVDFWVSGVEGVSGLSCERTDVPNLGNNYFEEFHTFALLWEEDYYWAFLDGQLVARNAHAYGTSNVKEEVLLTLCLPQAAFPDFVPRDYKAEMVTDWIRIWQKQP